DRGHEGAGGRGGWGGEERQGGARPDADVSGDLPGRGAPRGHGSPAGGSGDRSRPNTRATRMLTRYSRIIGAANTHCVTTSGVGVITAATMKMIRMAYLKWRHRNPAVISPRRARK